MAAKEREEVSLTKCGDEQVNVSPVDDCSESWCFVCFVELAIFRPQISGDSKLLLWILGEAGGREREAGGQMVRGNTQKTLDYYLR